MKIIFTTVHPAPYFDRLFAFLKANDIFVEAWYLYRKTSEKDWKTYQPKDIHLYKDSSLIGMANKFSKADFVVLHWGNWKNIVISLFLKVKKTRFAYYLDHPDPSSSRTSKLMRIVKKFLFNMSTYIYPACYSCADYLVEMYGISRSKIRVFPYSHSESCSNIDLINADRSNCLKNNGKLKLLIASRFVERKGYSIVVELFELMKKSGILDEFDIQIVGNGEQYDVYKNKIESISKDIRLHGWIENEAYEQLLAQTDIYLHPSFFEPFGIPPLDAMERNKFVVVSDQVKSTDVFTNEPGVKIYPAHDSTALYNIMLFIHNNKRRLYDLTSSNAFLCSKMYSMNVNLKALE